MKKLLVSMILSGALSFTGMASAQSEDVWAPIEIAGKTLNSLVTFDVGDYVQDGLVAHFDGIRNSGRNLPHDATLNGWTNLVSSGPNLSFYKSNGSAVTLAWKNGNAYSFSPAGTYAKTDDVIDFGANNGRLVTIEMHVDNVLGKPQCTYPYLLSMSGSTSTYSGFYGNSSGNAFNWDDIVTTTKLQYPTSGLTWNGKFFTAIADADTLYFFDGNQPSNAKARGAGAGSFGNRIWYLAADCYRTTSNYLLNGDYHSLRIYNRVLSTEELRQNRMIDEVRFQGVGGNVIVQTEMPGIEANEPTGAYCVSGYYEFTRSNSIFAGDKTYGPAGYKLEVLDPETGAVTEEIIDDYSTSFTYTNCLARAHVRLTWRWSVIGSSRVASGELENYVQDGLIAHYDGICNDGADAAHNPDAAVWKNLVAGGPDMIISNTTANITLSWTNGNAFAFDGKSYAVMTTPLTVDGADAGKALTVEMVFDDVDLAQGGTPYPLSYLGSKWTDCGIYWNGRESAEFTVQIPGNSIFTFPQWNGNYLTTILNSNKSFLFDETMPGESHSRSANSVSGKQWMFAASHYSGLMRYNLKGSYHAVRFYNRALTEPELNRNRFVDEMRFRGAPAMTNVIVQTKPADVEGVARGKYAVMGKIQFTAPAVTLEGKTVIPSNYAIETMNESGAWSAKEIRSGAQYVYDADAMENRMVRLTWLYQKQQGLIIIVR